MERLVGPYGLLNSVALLLGNSVVAGAVGVVWFWLHKASSKEVVWKTLPVLGEGLWLFAVALQLLVLFIFNALSILYRRVYVLSVERLVLCALCFVLSVWRGL